MKPVSPPNNPGSSPPRWVLICIGFGDGIASYRAWRERSRFQGEVAVTYTAETLNFLEQTTLGGVLVSTFGPASEWRETAVHLYNEPKPSYEVRGRLSYHWAQWVYARKLVSLARAYGAKTLVIDSGVTHWSFFLPAVLTGMQIIPNFHNVWRKPPADASGMQRLVFALDSWFLRHFTRAALGVSPACMHQYRAVSSPQHHFELYLAQFDAHDFVHLPAADFEAEELHLIYVGRVEAAKGVFDLLEAVRRLRATGQRVRLSVAGDGSALPTLRAALDAAAVADPSLPAAVHLLGQLPRSAVLGLYAACHMVVVPTRSNFHEGFPKVCAEGAMAGRVIVTSRHTESAELLDGALVEFETDSVDALCLTLQNLLADRPRLHALAQRARAAAEHFTDRSRSMAQALHRLHDQGFL